LAAEKTPRTRHVGIRITDKMTSLPIPNGCDEGEQLLLDGFVSSGGMKPQGYAHAGHGYLVNEMIQTAVFYLAALETVSWRDVPVAGVEPAGEVDAFAEITAARFVADLEGINAAC